MTNFETAAKARLAHFRQSSPTISIEGKAPSDTKGSTYAHLLALGHEEENLYPPLRGPGGAVEFFRQRGIPWWKAPQTGDEGSREFPTRNLASSQICCVNFLLPLATTNEAIRSVLTALHPDVEAVPEITYPRNGQELASQVEFEWVGLRDTLEGTSARNRGALATSADALILADLPAGGRRAYLLEWKYVESYPSDQYLGDGAPGATRIGRYSPGFSRPSAIFSQEIPLQAWLYKPFDQILRLLLLGQKMIDEGELGVTEFVTVVVCPEENIGYRSRITSPVMRSRFPTASTLEEVVHSSLRNPGLFRIASQEDLLSAIAQRHSSDAQDWLSYHEARYAWVPRRPGA